MHGAQHPVAVRQQLAPERIRLAGEILADGYRHRASLMSGPGPSHKHDRRHRGAVTTAARGTAAGPCPYLPGGGRGFIVFPAGAMNRARAPSRYRRHHARTRNGDHMTTLEVARQPSRTAGAPPGHRWLML